MYILLALIAACALGVWLHFLLPHRESRGVAVAPGIATAAAAVIYTALQWAGLSEGNGWLWLASIGGALAISAVTTLALSAIRAHRDAASIAAIGI